MERVKTIITDALSNTFVEALKAKRIDIYIVGGAIRDAFYGKNLKDFDFIVRENDFEKVLDFFEKSNLKYFFLNAKNLQKHIMKKLFIIIIGKLNFLR